MSVRRVTTGPLVTNTATVLVVAFALTAAALRPDPAPAPAPYRSTVVQTQCIDGRINQSIDDGNPAGLLAYDTGVSC